MGLLSLFKKHGKEKSDSDEERENSAHVSDNINRMLAKCLVEDPIYGNTAWRKEYSDGDVFEYMGYKTIEWYCPQRGVSAEEAINCAVDLRAYCKYEMFGKCDFKLPKLIYIRVDSIVNLSDSMIKLCRDNSINVIVDRGERTYYSLTQKLLYSDNIIWGYGSADDAATKYIRSQKILSKPYILDDFMKYQDESADYAAPLKKLSFDRSTSRWRLRIQLDKESYWFLSVFFSESGKVEQYSLDFEGEHDSHYVFTDEEGVREALYDNGDESKYLDEIFSGYAGERGGSALKGKLIPFIREEFHY